MDLVGRWQKLARDTALLTGSSLIMRCIGMAFQVWLAGRIGASGVGLYQLVASVNMLCATFAISGIRFTTTRLVSEELGAENPGSIPRAMKRCVLYALVFGSAAFLVLFTGAEPIGFLWVGDARTVLSLRIIAFRMPFIALSSVLSGYFLACGRAYKSAFVQLLEQLVSIALVMFFLREVPGGEIERSCAAVSLGGTLADMVSLLLVSLLYLHDRRHHHSHRSGSVKLTGRMFKIAVPLALSAYARTSLTTLQNLLIPRKLKASGLSADSALAGYGTISGMVMPIITFPTCLLYALSELLIPNLTEAQVSGDFSYIDRTVSSLLRIALLFALSVSAFLLLTADAIGWHIYHADHLGKYIRLLAPLIPFMYLDIVTDGCLKGLGQMIHSMRYNISEALLGVLMVAGLLPVFALNGYIFVLYFCELFNFTLSIRRLKKIAHIRLFSPQQPQKAPMT